MENGGDILDARIAAIAAAVVEKFSAGGDTVDGAESCTGGAVASAIVSIAGASACFKGSAVCYCDGAKQKILGVKARTLKKHFAESRECAEEMARGAMELYGADAAFAATGFLDANTGGKPQSLAGKVFAAIARKNADGKIRVNVERLELDPAAPRNFNRKKCVLKILTALENIG